MRSGKCSKCKIVLTEENSCPSEVKRGRGCCHPCRRIEKDAKICVQCGSSFLGYSYRKFCTGQCKQLYESELRRTDPVRLEKNREQRRHYYAEHRKKSNESSRRWHQEHRKEFLALGLMSFLRRAAKDRDDIKYGYPDDGYRIEVKIDGDQPGLYQLRRWAFAKREWNEDIKIRVAESKEACFKGKFEDFSVLEYLRYRLNETQYAEAQLLWQQMIMK